MSEDNPFMDVESVATKVLGEEWGATDFFATTGDNDKAVGINQVYIKEKKAILFYIQELIRHAAKTEDINITNLIPQNNKEELTIKSRKENT